jgi:hypothetical protein
MGIVAYFSHIPQTERPRTLMIYLDNRHYMPGMEKAFEKQDYFAKKPEAKKSIVALVATEHLGQIEFRETDTKYEPTGKVEPSFLWTRNNQKLIDMAVKAVKDHRWPRVVVQCVERPGVHGGSQGVWYGMEDRTGLEPAGFCHDGNPGRLLGNDRADQHFQQRAFLHRGSRDGPADRRADESRAEIINEVRAPDFDLADVVLLSQCPDLLDGHRVFEAPSWGSVPLLSPCL